jgi:hypothetical protein
MSAQQRESRIGRQVAFHGQVWDFLDVDLRAETAGGS